MYMSTWEKGQPRIHKIYEDDGGWKCQVSWDDLKVNEYPARVVYTRCPRKVGHAFGGKGLLTNLKQAFSYWEREVRKLRAERACAGEFAQQRVRESTPEVSTPHTPAIASPPPQQWRAPEADMYGHDNVKRRHITASQEERFAGDVRSR
jgi:hypothetical protein